jgi:beta-glucosidase
MTFPRNVGQLPLYYNHKNTGRPAANDPESVFWSHSIDEANTPLFAFGHGLSYSKFEYKNLKVSKSSFTKGESVQVQVELTNTSSVEGKEVVQLYIRDMVGSFTRPVKELKGFEQVILKPLETKVVSFTIDEKMLSFYTANKTWESESGTFKVFIGGSSDQLLETEIVLK